MQFHKTQIAWKQVLFVGLSLLILMIGIGKQTASEVEMGQYIVQGNDITELKTAVIGAGGIVNHELTIIDSLSVSLPEDQVEALRQQDIVTQNWEDRVVAAENQETAVIAPPVEGYESTGSTFHFDRAIGCDGSYEKMNRLSKWIFYPDRYLSYTFKPAIEGNLPSTVALDLTINESRVYEAKVESYHASTAQWHTIYIETLPTDIYDISVSLDISHILTSEEDFAEVTIRLFAYRQHRAGYLKVDCLSLRYSNPTSPDPMPEIDTNFFTASKVDQVWGTDNLGAGIGVAVLDTGVYSLRGLRSNVGSSNDGIRGGIDFVDWDWDPSDPNGHGTHVASIISSSGQVADGYFGAAPNSHIIPIRVLNEDGKGTYSDVISGIQYAMAYKDDYNIRILNLSLAASPQSHYWDDPLNRAVMEAWHHGIVVIVSAGNAGPDPMTIGVPGNNPYVITVGALDDNGTPADWADDHLSQFSSAGPTYEGFVKPDVLAPGGHIVGLINSASKLAERL